MKSHQSRATSCHGKKNPTEDQFSNKIARKIIEEKT